MFERRLKRVIFSKFLIVYSFHLSLAGVNNKRANKTRNVEYLFVYECWHLVSISRLLLSHTVAAGDVILEVRPHSRDLYVISAPTYLLYLPFTAVLPSRCYIRMRTFGLIIIIIIDARWFFLILSFFGANWCCRNMDLFYLCKSIWVCKVSVFFFRIFGSCGIKFWFCIFFFLEIKRWFWFLWLTLLVKK